MLSAPEAFGYAISSYRLVWEAGAMAIRTLSTPIRRKFSNRNGRSLRSAAA